MTDDIIKSMAVTINDLANKNAELAAELEAAYVLAREQYNRAEMYEAGLHKAQATLARDTHTYRAVIATIDTELEAHKIVFCDILRWVEANKLTPPFLQDVKDMAGEDNQQEMK